MVALHANYGAMLVSGWLPTTSVLLHRFAVEWCYQANPPPLPDCEVESTLWREQGQTLLFTPCFKGQEGVEEFLGPLVFLGRFIEQSPVGCNIDAVDPIDPGLNQCEPMANVIEVQVREHDGVEASHAEVGKVSTDDVIVIAVHHDRAAGGARKEDYGCVSLANIQ
ncbi:MAG: hypothetical protein ABMA64_02630 [Myxococcota bacterium]